jgi:hypothetical protein
MKRELGREVRDRLVRELREAIRPPRVVSRSRRVERRNRAVVKLDVLLIPCGRLQLLA